MIKPITPRFSSARFFGVDASGKPCIGVRLMVDGKKELYVGTKTYRASQADFKRDQLIALITAPAIEIYKTLQQLMENALLPRDLKPLKREGTFSMWRHEHEALNELFSNMHPAPLMKRNPQADIRFLDITLWRTLSPLAAENIETLIKLLKPPKPITVEKFKTSQTMLLHRNQEFWDLFHKDEHPGIQGAGGAVS